MAIGVGCDWKGYPHTLHAEQRKSAQDETKQMNVSQGRGQYSHGPFLFRPW